MHAQRIVLTLLLLVSGCGGSASMAERSVMEPSGAMSPPAPMAEAAPRDVMAKEDAADYRSGFGGDEAMRSETMTAQLSTQPAQGQPGPAAPPPPPAKSSPGEPGGRAAKLQSPMLIYTAQLTMAVFEVSPSLGAIEELARDLGGFLAKRDDTSITIRVPAGRFDEAVARIEKVGDMLHRNVTAEDVTEEFMDLEVRLKNARAIRDRLEQLLAKALKVEESILIERELGRVAGEIERIEGRMKFLRDRAAFSTITVVFQARRGEEVTHKKPHLPVPWLYEMGLGRLLDL